MAKRDPSASRFGPRSTRCTEPDPSISAWRVGSARRSKIADGGAGTKRRAHTEVAVLPLADAASATRCAFLAEHGSQTVPEVGVREREAARLELRGHHPDAREEELGRELAPEE